MKQNPRRIGRTDISDLNEDPVVVWQHKNYLKTVFTMALLIPTLVCGFGWGDFFGGFIYGGILRMYIRPPYIRAQIQTLTIRLVSSFNRPLSV